MKITAIHGSDRPQVQARSRALLKEWAPSSWSFSEHWLPEEATESDLAAVLEAAQGAGLTAEPSTLWVHASHIPSQSKQSARFWGVLLAAEGRLLISFYQDSLPPDFPAEAARECFARPVDLAIWATSQAQAHGKTLSPENAQTVASRCGLSHEAVESAVQTLCAYCGEAAEIDLLAIDLLVPDNEELATWDWIDALVAGKVARAGDILEVLLHKGEPAMFYSALALRVTQLHQARAWLDSPASSRGDLALILSTGRSGKTPAGFAVEKIRQTAQAKTMAFWDRLFHLVTEGNTAPSVPATLREISARAVLLRPQMRRETALREEMSKWAPAPRFQVIWREPAGRWQRLNLREAGEVRAWVEKKVGVCDRVLVSYEKMLYLCLPSPAGYTRTPLPAPDAAWMAQG
jgi:hypothetical protein